MKLKGLICMMLISAMLCGCGAVAPSQTAQPSVPQETHAPTYPQDAPTEPRLPQISDRQIKMYYDDRLPLSALPAGGAVEIRSETVTSQKVEGGADSAVLFCDEIGQQLIAVGVGCAEIVIGETVFSVTVEAAPISLVMITGHSIGAGQGGEAAKSVVCNDGMAYSTHNLNLTPDMAAGVGIGYGAANKPEEIDAFIRSGNGTIGEGSAIAFRWNEITGEKIWVINAARGGTCLNEWVEGTQDYNKAVGMFRYAQQVLANEIAAGHYRLKDMAIIYHSAANYGYKNVTYTNELCRSWYDSMWNGFKKDLAMDVDGDGETETVQAMGFVPIWSVNSRKIYEYDKPANFFMGSNQAYCDMFIASVAIREWCSASGLKTFPAVDYQTHGEPVEAPASVEALFASDGVHHQQVVYNATGMDVAQNLYRHLRTYVKANEVNFVTPDGNKVYDSITIKKVGGTYEIVPVADDLLVSDLTFTVSDNLSLAFPCIITAVQPGTGTLTVSQNGVVLRTLTVEVKQ